MSSQRKRNKQVSFFVLLVNAFTNILTQGLKTGKLITQANNEVIHAAQVTMHPHNTNNQHITHIRLLTMILQWHLLLSHYQNNECWVSE